MSSTPQQLMRRTEKLERRQSFQRLLTAIETGSMSREEKVRILAETTKQVATGKITQTQANKLTKAIKL